MTTAQLHPAASDELEVFPLSFAQERLWFLEQLHPDTPQFVISTAIRVTGPLDVDQLERALAALVARHGVLRTRIVDRGNGPVQEMLPFAPLRLDRRDLSGSPDSEKAAADVLADAADRGFDLSVAPIMRGMVIRLAETNWILVLCLHHIVCDGVSVDILVRDLVSLYSSDGDPTGLPTLDIDYGDFAEWQRQEHDEAFIEAQLDFWAEELSDADPRTHLPVDGSPGPTDSRGGASSAIELPQDMGQAVLAAARREGVSPFMVILAAWQLVLVRTSGRRGVTVGTTVTGRETSQTAEVFGCFLNLVVLRSDIDRGSTIHDLLGRIRSRCQRVFNHADVPFERVVERIKPARRAGHGPLFDAMVAVQVGRRHELIVGDLRLRPEPLPARTAQYAVVLDVQIDNSGIDLCIGYSTEVLSAQSAGIMLRRLCTVLQAFTRDSDVALSDVPLDAATEPSGAVVAAKALPDTPSLADTFVAVGQVFTDLGIERVAAEVAATLTGHGIEPGTIVAVNAENPLLRAGHCIGVWSAGGCVLTLDHDDPKVWSRRIRRARGASAVLDTTGALVEVTDTRTSTATRSTAWCSPDTAVCGTITFPVMRTLLVGLAESLGVGPGDIVLISTGAHPCDVLSILLSGARPMTTTADDLTGGAWPDGVAAVWLDVHDWGLLLERGWSAPEGVVVVGDGAGFAAAQVELAALSVLVERSLPSGVVLALHRRTGAITSGGTLPGVAVRVIDDIGAEALAGAVGQIVLGTGTPQTETLDRARAGEPPELLGYRLGEDVVGGRVVDVELVTAALTEELALEADPLRCQVVENTLLVAGGPAREDIHRAMTNCLPQRLRPTPEKEPTGDVYRPSTSTTDELMTAILSAFRRSLESPDLQADDDFFDAGGTSLAAARLVRELSAATGTTVPVRALFAHPTAIGLRASLVAPAGSGDQTSALTQASKDAILDPDIRPSGRRRIRRPRRVLLTGATGFLGAHLLAELRSATDVEITCLVRADGDAAARRRLSAHLVNLRLDPDLTGIHCMAADLSHPGGFGMRAETLVELAGSFDVVLHSAAITNFSLPYRSLAATNVEATRQLLRLACTDTPSTFHYVSTMDAGLGGILTESPMPLERGASDGYVLSKKVGESLVLQAGERGLPVEVHRPGLITSSARTGATGSSDQFGLCLAASLAAGVLPATLPAPLRTLPVDEVAAHIVTLVIADVGDGSIHHLHDHRVVRLDEVRDLLAYLGRPLELVPFDRWRTMLARRTGGHNTQLAALLGLVGDPNGQPPRVSTTHADRRIGPNPWSEADSAYLGRVIDFLSESSAGATPMSQR